MLAKSCQFTTFAIHSCKIHEWCINRFNKADTLQLLKQLEFFHVFWFRIWLNQLVLMDVLLIAYAKLGSCYPMVWVLVQPSVSEQDEVSSKCPLSSSTSGRVLCRVPMTYKRNCPS